MNNTLSFILNTLKLIIVKGLPNTLIVLFGTLIISLPLGFLCGLATYKKVPVLSQILKVLISFFRGVPLMILIFLLYSALPDVIHRAVQNAGLDIDVYKILVGDVRLCAIGICSTFTIAQLSEVFRSALLSVNSGQLEACHTVGLTTFQSYIHVIIPQALVSAIPNIGNDVVGLIKGTSLMFYMGLADIMGVAKTEGGVGYRYVESYFDVLIVYVVLCFIVQEFFVYLEKKASVYKTAGGES